mgnify:CR=1 FL=1
MIKSSQRTINSQVECSGIALHSGQKVKISLIPAPVDSGIVFKRVDVLDKNNVIKAQYDNVVGTIEKID